MVRSVWVVAVAALIVSGCGQNPAPATKPSGSSTTSSTAPAYPGPPTPMTAGGAPAATNANDLPGLTQQLVDTMKTIKDEESAKAAAPKLEEIAGKLDELQEQAKNGKGSLPADPESFIKRQGEAMEQYGKELERISNIPGAPEQLQGMLKKVAP